MQLFRKSLINNHVLLELRICQSKTSYNLRTHPDTISLTMRLAMWRQTSRTRSNRSAQRRITWKIVVSYPTPSKSSPTTTSGSSSKCPALRLRLKSNLFRGEVIHQLVNSKLTQALKSKSTRTALCRRLRNLSFPRRMKMTLSLELKCTMCCDVCMVSECKGKRLIQTRCWNMVNILKCVYIL